MRGRACDLNVFSARYFGHLYKRDARTCRVGLLHSEKLRLYGVSCIVTILIILLVPDAHEGGAATFSARIFCRYFVWASLSIARAV